MADPLTLVADTQLGAFTRGQALRHYSPRQVRTRLASGQCVRVFHGVYRFQTAAPSAQLRITGAGLSLGKPVTACLHTAAELHGFAIFGAAATHVVADPGHPRRSGLIVHSTGLTAKDVCRYTGVPATTVERTAVELVRTLPRLDGLAALDAALRAGVVSPRSLHMELARHSRQRGVVVARELVDLADGRAESPMESRSRLRCIDGGLPPPELQIEVRAGHRCYRLDMGWRAQKVGLEYDSLTFHGSHATLRYDRGTAQLADCPRVDDRLRHRPTDSFRARRTHHADRPSAGRGRVNAASRARQGSSL